MYIQLNQTVPQLVKDIKIPDIFYKRIKTGIKEFDDFLSGGWLPGSVFTFTGAPGLGKSTLLLQLLNSITQQDIKAGYVSCEESIYQIAYNCERLKIEDVEISNISDVDDIIQLMPLYKIIVIDSFHKLTTRHDFNSKEHEKYCVERIVAEAKKNECVVGVIGHQTKSGSLKGSSLIPHEVDANMELGLPEEVTSKNQRLLSFSKNRFGKVWDMACEMGDKGYIFTSAPGECALISSQNETDQKTQESDAGEVIDSNRSTCISKPPYQTSEIRQGGGLGTVLHRDVINTFRPSAEIEKVLEYFNS